MPGAVDRLDRDPSLTVHMNVRRLAGQRTGIEVYIERLVSGLLDRGVVRVVGLTCVPLEIPWLAGCQHRVAEYRNLAPGRFGSQVRKLYFDHWGCLAGMRSTSDPVLFHAVDGALPRSLRRIDRAVATVFDLGPDVVPKLFDLRTRVVHTVSSGHTLRRADRLLAISRRTADDLIRIKGLPHRKIEVVYLGVDTEFFASPGDSHREVESPYFLAVGGISPRKNSVRLLHAFRKWKSRGKGRQHHRLVVTGTSKHSLESPAVRAELGEDVELLGHIEEALLKRLYRGAVALLYPSLYEGFGLPIVEAMACGTPVLTSTTGAAPEVAGGAAVLVDPYDTNSIEEGIDRISTDGEQDRLRSMGPERARAFTWQKCVDGTIEVYRGVSS